MGDRYQVDIPIQSTGRFADDMPYLSEGGMDKG